MSDVVLISYPSGGFGNFIFHALTCHSSNTFKTDQKFKFSNNGNSHSTIIYTNRYFKDPDTYLLEIPDPSKTTLVLCDNGLDNDSYNKIKQHLPAGKIVRLCIDPAVRPVVYQTYNIKAKCSTIENDISEHVLNNWGDSIHNYSVRENFTLLYHNWPFGWGPVNGVINVSIEKLYLDPVDTICSLIGDIGDTVINKIHLEELCMNWKAANKQYFEIYDQWNSIELSLDNRKVLSLRHITSLHDQGFINYCIEKKYKVTIPVYDYKDWFNDTESILTMVTKLNEK